MWVWAFVYVCVCVCVCVCDRERECVCVCVYNRKARKSCFANPFCLLLLWHRFDIKSDQNQREKPVLVVTHRMASSLDSFAKKTSLLSCLSRPFSKQKMRNYLLSISFSMCIKRIKRIGLIYKIIDQISNRGFLFKSKKIYISTILSRSCGCQFKRWKKEKSAVNWAKL